MPDDGEPKQQHAQIRLFGTRGSAEAYAIRDFRTVMGGRSNGLNSLRMSRRGKKLASPGWMISGCPSVYSRTGRAWSTVAQEFFAGSRAGNHEIDCASRKSRNG